LDFVREQEKEDETGGLKIKAGIWDLKTGETVG